MAVSKKFGIHVENTVATATFGVRIPLEKLVKTGGMEYEPERFPGVVYRMKEPKVAFLLFGSGKVICAGARNVRDIGIAMARVSKKLKALGAIVKSKPTTKA